MRTDVFELQVKTAGADANFTATMQCYIPVKSREIDLDRKFPAVVILPGGGYKFTSDREAEPIALSFAAAGFAAFLVRYSCVPAVFPQALCEAAEAIATVRARAEEFSVDPHKIAVCGFSAGGHLAASISTMYGSDAVLANLGGKPEDYRPDAQILCYPVISMQCPHVGSFKNLLGDAYTEEKAQAFSLETLVTEATPPAFLWATATDASVPVKNTYLFASALADHGVPAEVHVYPAGPHGLGLSNWVTTKDPKKMVVIPRAWMGEATRWLTDLFVDEQK